MYLIVDIYLPFSTKSNTKSDRKTQASKHGKQEDNATSSIYEAKGESASNAPEYTPSDIGTNGSQAVVEHQ